MSSCDCRVAGKFRHFSEDSGQSALASAEKEAAPRSRYGYDSVDDYYAGASSDQRLASVRTPPVLVN